MNRSRAGGYGDEYAGHPGPEGYDAGYDADRFQDRADYHDFDAAYGDDYDDGAAQAYQQDYAPFGEPAGYEAQSGGYDPRDAQAGYGAQAGYDERAGRGRRGRPDEAYEAEYDDRAGYAAADAGYGDGYEDDGYDDRDGREGRKSREGRFGRGARNARGGHDDHGHDDHDGDDYDDDGYDGYDDEDDEPELSDRIFTIPNLISVARLAGVPLFLGLILSPYYGGPKYDGWALVVLALSGFSDWLDGKLARRWNQQTKFGAMLDPLADRLYILSTLVGFTMRGIIPLWLPIVLVGRDVAMLILITPKLRKAGYGVALPVHFLGKAATFNLLYAFPLLLLGQIGEDHKQLMDIGNIFGWAFVGWGTALYLLAGGMYFVQAQQVTRDARAGGSR